MVRNITISLSINAMLERIYATSALDYIMNKRNSENRDSITILTHDQREALRLQLKDSFAHILLQLLPHIASSNVNDLSNDDIELFIVELQVPTSVAESNTIALRQTIENCITLDTLAMCQSCKNQELASQYRQKYQQAIKLVKSLLTPFSNDLHITQHWL